MKTKLLLLFSFFAYSTLIFAQDEQNFFQISTGAGYGKQVFYDLDKQSGVELDNDDWDLIFTTFGLQDAGIHINETTSSTFGQTGPGLEFYKANSGDFASITSFIDSAFTRVFNDEQSWLIGGINVDRDPSNFLDYGWGNYNPMTRQVVGDEVFVLKRRDGSYLKFVVENLDATIYNIKYADLDGSNEQTASIDKANYPGGLAPFSFESGALDVDLSGFDMAFIRYYTVLIDTTDDSALDYPVTGILSGLNVEVAKIEDMVPADVVLDSVDNYESRLDVIGWDWKNFNFTDGWVFPENLSYVVKTNENNYYQLIFNDFEGSSTGVATIELVDLGVVSSVNDPLSVFEDFNIFPNPVQGQMNLSYTLKERQNQVRLILSNQLGQQVWNATTDGLSGLNARSYSLPNLPTGSYFLTIQAGSSLTTRKLNLR